MEDTEFDDRYRATAERFEMTVINVEVVDPLMDEAVIVGAEVALGRIPIASTAGPLRFPGRFTLSQ